MYSRYKASQTNIYEVFSDMSLLMLSAFIFLFALILITSQLQGSASTETEQQRVEKLQAELDTAHQEVARLQAELVNNIGNDASEQESRILQSAGFSDGQGRKDFEMFIDGLKRLPGRDLHLVIDATGSMHGVTSFLIPVLRLIAIRSGKHLSGVSWYADNKTGTFTGSMGAMLDQLMQEAPFSGADESIGHAFAAVARQASVPGAYLLIGDEPPSDIVRYQAIPAPVFALPLGSSDSSTKVAYRQIAENTDGRMLELKFQ